VAQTSVPAGSALAVKRFSVALFAQTLRNPSLMKMLTGPAPKMAEAQRKLKNQTSPSMPCVRVTDLSKTAGDTVSVDAIDIISGKPLMGDVNAEGKGEALTFSSMDIKIDLTTKVVDAGGRMTQQRTVHNMRQLALANLGGYMPRLESQICLTHLAGGRGQQTGQSWALPLDTDPDFASIVINPVQAPTYNRHYVCDPAGSQTELLQGGVNMQNLTAACTLKLEHIDFMRTVIDDMEFRPQPVKIADDPAAEDEPLYLWLAPPRSYQALITNTSGQVLRTFQQNAWNRASWGSKHPLFRGEVGIWNGILVKKIDYSIRWGLDGSTAVPYNTSTDNGAETGSDPLPSVAGNSMERNLLLGAQALANVYGRNQTSDYYYGWNENWFNFDRNLEIAGEMMTGKAKLRFSPPDENGTPTVTDHGVFAIDVTVGVDT
jgi:N4-gp56 family major capsid protein